MATCTYVLSQYKYSTGQHSTRVAPGTCSCRYTCHVSYMTVSGDPLPVARFAHCPTRQTSLKVRLSHSHSHTLFLPSSPCFHASMLPCFRVSVFPSHRLRSAILSSTHPSNVERWIHDKTVAPFFFSEVLLLMDAHTLRTSRRQPFWEGTAELVLMDDTVSTVSTA